MNAADLVFWAGVAAGGLASALALYGRYRVLPAFLTGPEVCKLEAGGCQALFRTPEAALLGLPNSALGVAYHALVALGRAAGWPEEALLLAASLALAMTARLAYLLLSRGLECRVCWVGHAANLAIWGVLARDLARSP